MLSKILCFYYIRSMIFQFNYSLHKPSDHEAPLTIKRNIKTQTFPDNI